MATANFYNSFVSDYTKFVNFKDTRNEYASDINKQRGVSLGLRGLGVIVLASAANAMLSMAFGPHLTVARVAYSILTLALGHDLIVTGSNMSREVNALSGNVKSFADAAAPAVNLAKSFWNNGISGKDGFFDQNFDRYLVNTYIFLRVYNEAKALHDKQ